MARKSKHESNGQDGRETEEATDGEAGEAVGDGEPMLAGASAD